MDIMVTILVAVLGSGLINMLLTRYFQKQDKKKEEKTGTRQALRLLMKDRLRFLCLHFIQQNWIYEDELDDILAMHKCYHDELKGNGYLDVLMNKVKNLEVRGAGIK